MRIRKAKEEDAKKIADLYNVFIESSVVTFETEIISMQAMWARIEQIREKYPFLVAEIDGEFAGYAYATSWKPRQAYSATVESTIYMRPQFTGKGLGFELYTRLLHQLKENHIHAVLGGIALPNEASIALHKKCGFEHVGTLREVGFKLDRWIDVAYYEIRF